MVKVNEIFGPTIQGEGKSAGMSVFFLRLSGCNLHCIWCDTPHTWNWIGTSFEHPIKYDKAVEQHEMTVEQIIEKFNALGGEPRSLIVSGGEPLIQQKQLIPLFKKLKELGWRVEVETNGTVPPMAEIFENVDQINCSPKLSNSKDPQKLRMRLKALEILAGNPKVNFKFVVESPSDIPEILEYVNIVRQFGDNEIRLMPLSQTKEELLSREVMVQKLCSEYGFIYCTRLSILISGTKRGV